jgi:DnaJ homolog subfamily B member 12
MGGGGFRQAGARQEPADAGSMFYQLLPLILLFGLTLLSSLPSLFTTPPVPDPHFSFAKTSRYNVERETHGLGVKYHINVNEFVNHPVFGPDLSSHGIDLKNPESSRSWKGPNLNKFEVTVDKTYQQELYIQCQRGLERKERMKDAEMGIFGIGTDWEKVRKIKAEPIPACDELQSLGRRKGLM